MEEDPVALDDSVKEREKKTEIFFSVVFTLCTFFPSKVGSCLCSPSFPMATAPIQLLTKGWRDQRCYCLQKKTVNDCHVVWTEAAL